MTGNIIKSVTRDLLDAYMTAPLGPLGLISRGSTFNGKKLRKERKTGVVFLLASGDLNEGLTYVS